MYHSQFGEDRILDGFFKDRNNGVCVEVGANDGITGSNSYFFEKNGWTCVLVEPNVDLCAEIRRNRTALLFECAASDHSGTATLQIAEGAELAHAISTLEADGEAARRIDAAGFTARPVEVALRRLDDILDDAGLKPPIDFVTIDVEGHEMSVLAGFSVSRWAPTILIVEDNDEFRDRTVTDHLRQFGYVPFRRTGVNDWYGHQDNRALVGPLARLQYGLTSVVIRTGVLKAAHATYVKTALFALNNVPGARRLYNALRGRP
jgi:FkbM family methyltransferase